MSNIPRDILLIVREYLIHPADYFRLRRSCQHTSLMPREFPVVMHSLLRICSESRFPMTSSECSKLHLVGTGERIGITDLRRGQVETLLSCLTSECGVGMFCRILDLKLVDPFLLFDSAMKLVPLAVAGFAINLLTGVCFFASDPFNYGTNWMFGVKMVLIVLAGINAIYHEVACKARLCGLPEGVEPDRTAKFVAASSLVLWTLVIIAGRLLPQFGIEG